MNSGSIQVSQSICLSDAGPVFASVVPRMFQTGEPL